MKRTESLQILINEIESCEEIKNASLVLKKLEERGLKDTGIASGWIRSFLTGSPRTDIDIAYVGDVHFELAQGYLEEILSQLGLDKELWDIKGIWNAQIEYPQITSTEMNYLLFYVNSIDCVCLKSDGKLHDVTGNGFSDSQKKILRMNDFTKYDFPFTDSNIVYFCMEGCRRIAKFGWKPTKKSVKLIKTGLDNWKELSGDEKDYFITNKIKKKFSIDEREYAQKVYNEYGWGFLFDLVK